MVAMISGPKRIQTALKLTAHVYWSFTVIVFGNSKNAHRICFGYGFGFDFEFRASASFYYRSFCAICVYHFLSKLKLQIVCRAQYGWYFGKFHFDFRRFAYLFISILDISPKSLSRFNRLHASQTSNTLAQTVYRLWIFIGEFEVPTLIEPISITIK